MKLIFNNDGKPDNWNLRGNISLDKNIAKVGASMKLIGQDFRLYKNYPNPFNAGTDIRYDLPIQKDVKLTIHNLLGQAVKVLVNKKQVAGNFAVHWDGTDTFGKKLPSRIYFYKLQAGYWILTKKMMLLQLALPNFESLVKLLKVKTE